MDYATNHNTTQQENKKFHRNHGSNIIFSEDHTVAYRIRSFDGAEIYSHSPLMPGELFLIEIEETERGWSGHMRIGLTRIDPNSGNTLVPVSGDSNSSSFRTEWIVGISKAHINAAKAQVLKDIQQMNCNERQESASYSVHTKRLHYDSESIRTCKGVIPKYFLKSNRARGGELYPSDVGSRIGVMFIPTSENSADMHMIINGKDEGPLSTGIPYRDSPLYVVIDLYGTTKKIRIIQSSYVTSLQAACRESILQRVPKCKVHLLPLPKLLKNFLLFEV